MEKIQDVRREKMRYEAVSNGVTLEFSNNRELVEKAYRESRSPFKQFFIVASNGNKSPVKSHRATYKDAMKEQLKELFK